MSDREQELLSRAGALHIALTATLAELTKLYGADARTKLRAIRAGLIQQQKNSEVPAVRELDHAKIVGPAIKAIETAFEGFV